MVTAPANGRGHGYGQDVERNNEEKLRGELTQNVAQISDTNLQPVAAMRNPSSLRH